MIQDNAVGAVTPLQGVFPTRNPLDFGRRHVENKEAIERVEANMPSLGHLEMSLRGKRELGHILGVHGPPTPRGKQIADGYVRLVEKTILEYQESREKLVAFLKDGTLDHYFRAQDHFESSTQSLHRAILYLDRLRRLGFRQADGSPFIPRPSNLEVLRDDVKERVRQLRDLAEHLDKDIIEGKILDDADVAIHLGWDKAHLGETEIAYVDFIRWIEQLHYFALLLSRVQVVVGERPDGNTEQDDV